METVTPQQPSQTETKSVPPSANFTLPFSMAEQFINGDPSKRAIFLNPQFSGEESQQAAQALNIAGYRFSPEEIANATNEFKAWATQKHTQGSLGVDRKTFESIIAVSSGSTETKPDVFDFLKQELTESQLSQLMAGEHPQTIAVIASHLKPAQRNLVLSDLPEDAKKALEERIKNAQNADPAALLTAARTIKSKVEEILRQEKAQATAETETIPEDIAPTKKETYVDIQRKAKSDLETQVREAQEEIARLKDEVLTQQALARKTNQLEKELKAANQESAKLREQLTKMSNIKISQTIHQQPETPSGGTPSATESSVANNTVNVVPDEPSPVPQIEQQPPPSPLPPTQQSSPGWFSRLIGKN